MRSYCSKASSQKFGAVRISEEKDISFQKLPTISIFENKNGKDSVVSLWAEKQDSIHESVAPSDVSETVNVADMLINCSMVEADHEIRHTLAAMEPDQRKTVMQSLRRSTKHRATVDTSPSNKTPFQEPTNNNGDSSYEVPMKQSSQHTQKHIYEEINPEPIYEELQNAPVYEPVKPKSILYTPNSTVKFAEDVGPVEEEPE